MNSNQVSFIPAPYRFVPSDEIDKPWLGKPSISYGVARLLAFQERQKQSSPYLRVLFGEGGRRGDPWGAAHLEVNGNIYHFYAGMQRYPDLHNGQGGLTQDGNKMLANGLEGVLSFNETDWRWIQAGADLTHLFQSEEINQIHNQFHLYLYSIRPPVYQSKIWAQKLECPVRNSYFNCTTIIATVLSEHSKLNINQTMPLELFEHLRLISHANNYRPTVLEVQLNSLLWMEENQLHKLLPANNSWNMIAKGVEPVPDNINFHETFNQYFNVR